MTPLGLRRKISLSFLFIFFLWLGGLIWFAAQIPKTQSKLSENSDAAIIVLTGGAGRMEYGLQLLAQHKGSTLFVSGVGEKVTVADIVKQAPDDIEKTLNESDITIGHRAENTIGNAEEIKKWLKSSHYKNIILVTSNYHMPRSLLEIETTLPTINIIPAPVISGDSELLFSEYHKYIASKLRHLFVSATQHI